MNIGKFINKAEGKISGKMETLTFAAELVFYPNTDKRHPDEPDFRVYRSAGEVGAAWRKNHENCGDYISVKLDSPLFPTPLYVALFATEDGNYRMGWERQKKNDE